MNASSAMRVVLLAALLLITSFTYAQLNAPKYSNKFLAIGTRARALGMAGTQVATASDVTVGYWNTAGLTGIGHQHELVLMHAEYFAGIAKIAVLSCFLFKSLVW